ncbi:hypothetical protein [Tessaracoccus terricola]
MLAADGDPAVDAVLPAAALAHGVPGTPLLEGEAAIIELTTQFP